MTLILTVIVIALIFEYINGFHDTANSIATVVSTKVLTPRQAVMLAAVTNLFGAMWGTAVAKTITGGIVDSGMVAMTSDGIICALLGAIAWNLLTWWFGLPSSSSHALIGALCGAALAASHGNWHSIIWSQPNHEHWYLGGGLLWKVIVPMILSPLAGFVLGFILMAAPALHHAAKNQQPFRVSTHFSARRRCSAPERWASCTAPTTRRKPWGIIALVLLAGTKAGHFAELPAWLSFLKTPEPPAGKSLEIALWIKVICALTMASGTAVGGWRIIRTLGHKMVKLHPINGFAAEASSATVIGVASIFGIPVSTTHNISAAIMGVGSARRFNAIKWVVVERMVWAWVLTIPVAAAIAYGLVRLMQMAAWVP